MVTFSQRALKTIDDFVSNIGMQEIAPANDGSFTFAFEHAGVMSLTPSMDGKRAILSLKKMPIRQPLTEDIKAFLKLAQFDPITRKPITAGMAANGGLVLAISIDENSFDLPTIEACLDRLIELYRITKGNRLNAIF